MLFHAFLPSYLSFALFGSEHWCQSVEVCPPRIVALTRIFYFSFAEDDEPQETRGGIADSFDLPFTVNLVSMKSWISRDDVVEW